MFLYLLGMDKIPYRMNFCVKSIFRKNGYPENFIGKCLKKFLGNIHLVKEKKWKKVFCLCKLGLNYKNHLKLF